ncbi:hypothetical protein TNCV_3555861 [Trichonephila clavipes]|nr:hypothetical protein TNCV_3555861 [Trichonephila clavipes]
MGCAKRIIMKCKMILKFIKYMEIIPEGGIFHVPRKEKSGIDKSGEQGDESPLEMTRSLKHSVKTSILSRDA